MGNATWNAGSYAAYSSTAASKTQEQIFRNKSGMHADLDPAKFTVRESRDSAANPNSTPIIIGVDDTGSMGFLAAEIIKSGLGVIMQGIHDRKPVTDPHILLAAVGDATVDRAPLQATQFEADMRLVSQIEKFYIEGGGGGNSGESYPLVWWLARHKTSCDAISNRGKRGYVFTIGDEAPLMYIEGRQIRDVFGQPHSGERVDVRALLADAQARWNVFHLITPTEATRVQQAEQKWKALLGERAIVVDDHKRLGEVIVSIMQVNEGHDVDAVADSWGGGTGLAVRNAVSGLARRPSGPLAVESV